MRINTVIRPIGATGVENISVTFDELVESRYLNAIRRVLVDSKIPAKCLSCDIEDIHCEDPYFIHDYFLMNLESIPLKQDTPMDVKFSLKAKGTSSIPIDILSKDISGLAPKYASGLFTLTSLSSKYTLEAKNIFVDIRKDNARQSLACEIFAGDNHKTGKSEIRFSNMGTMPPKKLLKEAIKVVLKKFNGVKSHLDAFEMNTPYDGIVSCTLILPGEDSTVTEPIFVNVQKLFGKKVDIAVFDIEDNTGARIRMNVTEDLDPKQVITSAVDSALDFYITLLGLLD